MNLKVSYDPEVDVLYLATEGREQDVIEVYPGVNLEMDATGNLIGLEILNASRLLGEVIEPLRNKAASGSGRP